MSDVVRSLLPGNHFWCCILVSSKAALQYFISKRTFWHKWYFYDFQNENDTNFSGFVPNLITFFNKIHAKKW